ncbi:MAG: DUF4012 domain-containing protein [Nocardioides sp.]
MTDGLRKHRRRWRRKRIVAYGLLAVGCIVLAIGAILAIRYLPYLDRAREAKAAAQQLAQAIRSLDVDLTQQDLDGITVQVDDVDHKLQVFRDVLATDPLVGLARSVGVLREQIDGGAEAIAAADDLIGAARTGLRLGQHYVDNRTSAQVSAGSSTLANLVDLMATSTNDIDQINAQLEEAQQHLARIPANAIGDVREAHDLMAAPLAQYTPLLKDYASIDDILPGILGWNGARRYLVLAQDPAELRPIGGFAGTYGLVTFEGGRLSQHEFHDIYLLDLRPGLPYQEPPSGLKNHLLGTEGSWQLADALWSPDLPEAAQDAMRLYELESGGDRVDGLITITTYALDRLLSVLGPVEVPDYSVTVHAGEVTLTSLALTRNSADPAVNRKQFLQELATSVLDKTLTLPPQEWSALLGQILDIGDHHLASLWLRDPAAQALVSNSAWGAGVLQTPGDYLYVVDSNVAPASKYNLVVTRSTNLRVEIDGYGNALNTLQLTWQNDSMQDGEPYASLRSYSTGPGGIYGNYVRVLAPTRSRLQSVSGGSYSEITAPEHVEEVAGRTSFDNYLAVPPGSASLTYSWISPYPVNGNLGVGTDGIGVYTLTIQKQPGMTDEPISVTISVPENARITDASAGVTVEGNTATFSGVLTRDIQVAVRYVTTS